MINENYRQFVFLHTYSYIGVSLGAKHWQGTLICDTVRFVLEYTLSQGEARQMNLDADRLFRQTPGAGDPTTKAIGWYRPGHKTVRFPDRESVITEGLKTWKVHFPDAKVLALGNPVSAEPMPILVGPYYLKAFVSSLCAEAEAIGYWSEGQGDRMNEIMQDWCLILYGERCI